MCGSFTIAKRMKTTLVLLAAAVILKLAIIVAVIYVIVHFVAKLW